MGNMEHYEVVVTRVKNSEVILSVDLVLARSNYVEFSKFCALHCTALRSIGNEM